MAQISNRTARARAAMELKLSILSALNKLGDRDTQQMAVEELQRIAENLSQDGISVFLACLFDVGPEQKTTARKECVKILAVLSAIHGEMLSPHLPKIVAFLMRRLKDPDSQIRDVCVDTIGVLVARVPATENNANPQGGFLVVYTKPLFDSMGEQTKNVQIGAAMCLARVIENAPNLSPACIHRLAPRIIKVLSSPGFMAKAALLSAIGSLSRVAKDSGDEHLAQLVPCVQESLHCSDWTARKAAAETLSVLACPGLSKLKPSTLGVLDSHRFDKVKPVRDAVTCAIHVWKTVPGPELDSSLKLRSTNNNNTPEETPSFSRCWKEPDAEADCSGADAAKTYEQAESVSSDDKASNKGSSRKKAPAVSDLKMNPDFFRKLESKISDDWEVEVALPRVSPSQDIEGKSGSDKEFVSAEADSRTTVSGETDGSSRRSRTPVGSENLSEANSAPEGGGVGGNAAAASLAIKSSVETVSWLDATPEEQSEKDQKSQLWDGDPEPASTEPRLNGSDWILIQRQICQLERGQTELLEMLQDFMCTCQESMLSLQDRVQRLERSVENISSGRNSGGGNGRGATTTLEFTSRNRSFGDSRESDALGSRFLKLSDYEERFSINSDRSGRESPYSSIQELQASINYDTLRSVAGVRRESSRHQQHQQQHVDSEDHQPVARRAWDRGPGPVRSGEGPSARSVWRASKDEATLEAIRGAAGEEAVASDKSPEMVMESKQPELKQVAPPSWLFWTRAMENLHGGDVDCAYEEALSAEDDLLLVRMMNQTGPAFDHFSNSTAISMFRALLQILHQQHFLDAAFPWLDQVSELVRTKGADCFKFSMDAKRELVTSLHDTSALDFPERWMGNAVAKLALQLATAWSIDLLE
ncbi:microtubule-associated protein TORTIFOLIA1 isoform X1 [Selaginella moellendorffii]|uniref:microtubule-associated protein TORTIFOLIA1 isoform X1 n=1 Tax=Selaginella moellendorffii TaxID=88036 RepID=UPI000D1CC5DB|nr:microtubule-associated protein TORTIFOLIA1 isoform X1 [Selaginella moellendorffii]|eukprot:XP_024539581.1 microtubule-associated protein TORTIFOLIA1 isoform X1 [Selaginella moellendorffii]